MAAARIDQQTSAGRNLTGLISHSVGEHGIQKVTEIVEVKRTDDAWLQHVQDQIRNGMLSCTNHALMHVKPTKSREVGCVQESGMPMSLRGVSGIARKRGLPKKGAPRVAPSVALARWS